MMIHKSALLERCPRMVLWDGKPVPSNVVPDTSLTLGLPGT